MPEANTKMPDSARTLIKAVPDSDSHTARKAVNTAPVERKEDKAYDGSSHSLSRAKIRHQLSELVLPREESKERGSEADMRILHHEVARA
jgi:hypothetical protein